MNEQRFPAGWDQQRVQRLLAELDARTEEEWVAADEAAAAEGDDQSVREPRPALPAVHRQRGMSSHGWASARFGRDSGAAIQLSVERPTRGAGASPQWAC